MNWKIGQKLVFVDSGNFISTIHPIKGEIYTYDGCRNTIDRIWPVGIFLREFPQIGPNGILRVAFDPSCFREIVDIGDEVEEYIKSKITEPEYA